MLGKTIFLKNITEFELKNRRILFRVDFNIPIDNDGIIQSNFRIKAAFPTIKYCLSQGASIVLMSHLGRPGGSQDSNLSLQPVQNELEILLNKDVFFSPDCVSEKSIDQSLDLFPGEINLLENLRFHPGEESNDLSFAEKLAQHGEIFINDAFGTAHRKHASNVGVLNYFQEKGIGFLCKKELKFLKQKLEKPERPYSVILGGAKVAGKIELIQNLISTADNILIGGAMANPFLKAAGISTGSVKNEEHSIEISESLLKLAEKTNTNIVMPLDVIAVKSLKEKSQWNVKTVEQLPMNEFGADIGPETCALFSSILQESKTVFWNGPVGIAEIPEYSIGTQALAATLKMITQQGATTVIGGGDTASVIISNGLEENFSHISTGGGASIHLLTGKNLPAFSG